jgi:hypothetical protein
MRQKASRRGAWKLLLAGAVVSAATVLGGCNRTANVSATGPGAVASADPSNPIPPDWPKLPEGSACTGELEHFQAILKSDVDKGYINRPVYEQVQPELRTAADACAAGRDAEARKLVQASKKRYGYRS